MNFTEFWACLPQHRRAVFATIFVAGLCAREEKDFRKKLPQQIAIIDQICAMEMGFSLPEMCTLNRFKNFLKMAFAERKFFEEESKDWSEQVFLAFMQQDAARAND